MTIQRVAHYDLLEVLGSGGMGEVYRAFDTRLERPVAVKRIRLDRADDLSFKGRHDVSYEGLVVAWIPENRVT